MADRDRPFVALQPAGLRRGDWQDVSQPRVEKGPMNIRQLRFFLLFGAACVLGHAASLSAAGPVPPDAAGWRAGLTDRELMISRWFSQLTFMQDRSSQPWPEWHDDGEQLGTTSLRYQLAFAGYGCAAMAAQTPAYRELVQRQLGDLCERMIDVRVWSYITHYWKYGDDPPDPCRYENVMYTGHLTQLMCLYELLTGDQRYAEAGWDFVGSDGRKTHYDLRQAIERLQIQSVQNSHGGICCEPGLVFATCNSHSAASFVLFDLLHGTGYADVNTKWFAWMAENFRNKTPLSPAFFYLMYHQPRKSFLPVGDVGADGWALGWGYPWFPSTDLAREGWEHIRDKTSWQRPDDDTQYAPNSLLVGCCGGGSLAMSNAFLPLVAVQVEGRGSPTAGKLLRWLEQKYGRECDLDGDGHQESYCYHTCAAFRISATGNIAAALATDRDSLRQLFRTPRRPLQAAPTVEHVDYPQVYVRAAEYIPPTLRFVVLKGRPGFQGKTEIRCTQCPGGAVVSRDGQPFLDFEQTDSTVVIRTDLDREYTFQITFPGQASQATQDTHRE